MTTLATHSVPATLTDNPDAAIAIEELQDAVAELQVGGGGGVGDTPSFRWAFGQDGLFTEVQVQGSWSYNIPSPPALFGWYVGSGIVGDEIAVDVPLAAGTYDMLVCYGMSENGGIFTAYLDGVAVPDLTGVDTYLVGESGLATDHPSTATVTVAAAAVVRVSFRIVGKNAGSFDYNCILQGFSLKKV